MKSNPFEDFEDIALIKMSRMNDSGAIKELIRRYGKVYDSAISKLTFRDEYMKSDLIDDKYFFFYKMVKEYDSTRNMKFSTFIFDRARWMALAEIKKMNRLSDSLKLKIDTDTFEQIGTEKISDKIKTFDKRAQYIFEKRFFDNKKHTFEEIGAGLGLTYEGVRKIYKKHLKILKKSL